MGNTLETIDIHSTSLLQEQGYPWEAWDLLRRDAPVHWYERDDIEPFWAVTRYDDVHFVGSNDRLFVNGGARLRLASASDDREAKERSLRRAEARGWDPDEVPDLVYMDKPRHTEFRNLAARSFTPRAKLANSRPAKISARIPGKKNSRYRAISTAACVRTDHSR